jgi:hypothetical protein
LEFEKSKPSKTWMVSNVLSIIFRALQTETNSIAPGICFLNQLRMHQ